MTIFHEVVTPLHRKRFATTTEEMVAEPGRHARTWELTETGRAAAAFAALAARTLVDEVIDSQGRPARLLRKLIEAILSRSGGEAMLASDTGGYHVDAAS